MYVFPRYTRFIYPVQNLNTSSKRIREIYGQENKNLHIQLVRQRWLRLLLVPFDITELL